MQAGWLVQDRDDMNLTASDGIAVREFKLQKGHGFVDYLIFVTEARSRRGEAHRILVHEC